MKFGSGYAPSKTILIKNEKGQEYWLNFVDGKLDVGGNLPMSEAAEIFFAEVKQIAGVAMQQPTAPAGALTEDGVNRAAKALFDDRHCDSDFKDSADINQAFIECQHDARVVFKALSAPPGNSVKGEWQPIETAPKDGTQILLGSYVNDEWACMDDHWYEDRVMGGFDEWDEIYGVKPTHWMPLPKPPSATTKGSK